MRRALLVLALSGGTAVAQPAPAYDRAQAEERFHRGVELFEQGRFEPALAEFEASYALSGQWQLLFNIGVTQARLFRDDAAVQTFTRYLAAGGDGVTAARRAEVEDEEAHITKLSAALTITVEGAPADVTIDGLGHWTTPIGRSVLVPGGPHVIAATRAGEVADQTTITIISGVAAEVHLAPHPPEKAVTTGHLRITTRPAGASLTDGSTALGPAPWEGDLEHGTHPITATLPGLEPAREQVHLDAGERRELLLQLREPPPPPTPVYRRWYVLAAAGAVVIGGSIAIYAATRSTPDVVIRFPN